MRFVCNPCDTCYEWETVCFGGLAAASRWTENPPFALVANCAILRAPPPETDLSTIEKGEGTQEGSFPLTVSACDLRILRIKKIPPGGGEPSGRVYNGVVPNRAGAPTPDPMQRRGRNSYQHHAFSLSRGRADTMKSDLPRWEVFLWQEYKRLATGGRFSTPRT